MRLRIADLKEKYGKAMMAAAHFSAALHDELRSDDLFGGLLGNDEAADEVAEALRHHNNQLGEMLNELHDLEMHLY